MYTAMISRNGTPSAPQSAPSAIRHRQTEFLPDIAGDSWAVRLYLLSRAHLLEIPLIRWIAFLLVGLGLAWGMFSLPGGWVGGAFWLIVALALFLWVRSARRHAFTQFVPTSLSPKPSAQTLPPAQKRPLYVTGELSVEQKVRTFTALPGFYRTFATREHALLCRVRERRIWGFAAWPEEEVGLWYAFFTPQQIESIQPGEVKVGRQPLAGLSITYRTTSHSSTQRRQPTLVTLYLGFVSEEDRSAVLADLLVDWQPTLSAE
ncbi:MAG: hypothetical protein KJZ95_08760 [Caldilinea sp.]|nr:hypothetical protein [Caldilinea sp.]